MYSVRTDLEKIDIGPGKLLEFEKVPFVLQFCKIILENMKLFLKNIKIQLVL